MLDVGCGPGALTSELVTRLGADAVAAADPSEPFVQAARQRHPGVEVALAPAEDLPFGDAGFDVALAQLVVHFMRDPVAGLAEMRRVTRDGGVVAACVWDHAGGQGPLSPFWRAVAELDPDAPDESDLPGAREGHLAALFESAGLEDVEDDALWVHADHRASRSGGSRTPWVSGRRGSTSRGSARAPAPRCANAAACSSATGRCS